MRFLGLVCILIAVGSATQNDVAIPMTDLPMPTSFFAPGDSVGGFATRPESIYAVGVTFSRDSFFVSHGQTPIRVYVHNHNGVYVRDFAQIRSTGWGWRDLACSNDTFFGSDDRNVTQFGRNGQDYGDIALTGGGAVTRAMAYAPDSNFFYSADFASPIYVHRRTTGALVRQYANTYNVYGLAYDNRTAGGPYLWVYHQTPSTLRQFSLPLGAYTAIAYAIGGAEVAGGCEVTDLWISGLRTVICLSQAGPPDRVIIVEVAPGTGIKEGKTITLDKDKSAVAPNPLRSGKTLTFSLPNTGRGEVRVLDATGSLVRTLKVSDGIATWDGRLVNGETAQAGVYFYTINTDNGIASGKIVVVH